MKLFFVTYRDDNSNFTRAIVCQIAKRYAIARIREGVQHGVFTKGMFESSRYARNYGVASRAIVGCDSIEEALNMIDTVTEVHVAPLTLYQIKIIKTFGREMLRDMLSSFFVQSQTHRCSSIYSNLISRYYTNQSESSNGYFHWRGCAVYSNRYKQVRQLYADLGKLVTQAIHDGDATPVAEFIMNECTGSGVDNTELLHNIADNTDLDLGIVRCDCGHLEHENDTHSVGRNGNDTWCDTCFNDDAVYVEDRDEYWSRDDAYWSDYDNAYYSYERDQHDDDGEDEDPSNLMAYSTNVLHHIDKDPNIQSSPHGDFLMGIEFEMETSEGHYVSDAVDDVRKQLGESYCVCKSDGSLGHRGLEIVTAPRGLAEHIKRFSGWDVRSYYRAWDTHRCGLHVHIDSHAFTQMTLGKFVMLINSETNTDFIRKIAGRHPSKDDQARSYCASEYQPTLTNPKQAVKGKSSERYRMVNLQNLGARESLRLTNTSYYDGKYNTVELRIFRASLKKARMLAQIEFAHACVGFCRVASWRDLNQVSFVKWLKTVSSIYPNLADWYGVRRRNAKVTAESQCNDRVESV
jgi:hypothetical protein